MKDTTAGPLPRVTYHRLSREALAEIDQWRPAGVTIAGYVRSSWPDGVWRGDRCGCTDDRCAGYHHDAGDECGCLPVLLGQYADELRAAGGQP